MIDKWLIYIIILGELAFLTLLNFLNDGYHLLKCLTARYTLSGVFCSSLPMDWW